MTQTLIIILETFGWACLGVAGFAGWIALILFGAYFVGLGSGFTTAGPRPVLGVLMIGIAIAMLITLIAVS